MTSDWVKLPVFLKNGHKTEVTATVSDDFGTAIILGSPFLHNVGAVLDYDSYLLKTKFGAIPLELSPNLQQSNAKVNVHAVSEVSHEDRKVLDDLLENAYLDNQQKEQVRDLFLEFHDLWAGNPRGATDVYKHKIKVTTDRPVRQKPRRFTPDQQKIIDEEVQKMLEQGVIRPSHSPHAQEVVLVRKKTGGWRFCVDYRRLNDVTVPDEHPLPRIQDLIRSVRDSKFFVTLDLRSGYWQILMDNDSIPFTAFRTRSALYEFLVMAFGLCNAPASFSRLMDKILGDLYWLGVGVYLDDVLVHSSSFETAMKLLREVLTRLRKAKLTLAINKIALFPRSLLYLGYILEDGMIRPNVKRVEVLKRIKTPKSVKDVRSLLGCIGYFRQFIPNYSRIAEPLNRLLRKNVKFEWSPSCESAKNELIDLLVEVTLSNPLDGDLLKLETDASDTAIGAALYCRKTQEDPWKPVEFLSKNLSPTERNWPVHEREAFAIVHGLDKFAAYLRGRKFDVFTDNASLQWMNTSRPGKIARWAAFIQEFGHFRIIHRAGNTNLCADFLSRQIDNEEAYLPDLRPFGRSRQIFRT